MSETCWKFTNMNVLTRFELGMDRFQTAKNRIIRWQMQHNAFAHIMRIIWYIIAYFSSFVRLRHSEKIGKYTYNQIIRFRNPPRQNVAPSDFQRPAPSLTFHEINFDYLVEY